MIEQMVEAGRVGMRRLEIETLKLILMGLHMEMGYIFVETKRKVILYKLAKNLANHSCFMEGRTCK